MKSKKLIFQTHHLSYHPEITVKLLRSEHYWITRLGWFKELTAGAKKAIRFILKEKPTRRLPPCQNLGRKIFSNKNITPVGQRRKRWDEKTRTFVDYYKYDDKGQIIGIQEEVKL